MRIALAAPYPVQLLSGFPEDRKLGHHATWLPRISRLLETISGLEIHWITCTKAVDEPLILNERGQTFHLLPRKSLAVQMLTAFRYERSMIADLLQVIDPDLVHAWGSEEGYAYVAAGWPGKSIVSMQGVLTAYCSACPQPLLLRLQAWHERRAVRQIQGLTVESEWGADAISKIAPKAQVFRLEYGVDKECFRRNREPQEKPLALFVGTLSLLKGVDVLLEIFQDPRLSNVQLVVLGDGPLRRLQRGAPSNVRFIGHRPSSEVRDWMAKAWCLVHPARADTSPNVVKEARIMGLPVITTPNGGQAQYVDHGESGIINPISCLEGFIDAVLELTRNKEVGVIRGAIGQDRCRSDLGDVEISRQLRQIYQIEAV